MKASTALVALLAADLAAIAMVLGLAWHRTQRFTAFDTLFLLGFLVFIPLLMSFFYWQMEDHRPIVFFSSFMGLFLLPWLAMFAAVGPGAMKERTPKSAPQAAAVPEGAYAQEIPFADEAAARAAALEQYGGARRTETEIAGVRGFVLSEERPLVFLHQQGKVLRMMQAGDRAALEQMLRPAPAREKDAGQDFIDRIGAGKVFAGVLVYTLFVSWAFFRLVGWASIHLPPEGVAPAPAATLRERLLAVAKQDVPFAVRAGETPDVLIAEWRYADAKWLDQARAHAMHKAIRYRMRLDEASRSVRVLESRAEFDASAGIGGAGIQYKVQRGITFYEVQRETVFGLQIREGRLVPEGSYSWRFDVAEIRDPLVKIVNGAGWAWRPLMLDVPWLGG